jgi:hypothetical protein
MGAISRNPDHVQLTLKEIGEQFDITRQRVLQIEEKALERIARYLTKHLPKDWKMAHDIVDNRREKLAEHIRSILTTSESARFAVGFTRPLCIEERPRWKKLEHLALLRQGLGRPLLFFDQLGGAFGTTSLLKLRPAVCHDILQFSARVLASSRSGLVITMRSLALRAVGTMIESWPAHLARSAVMITAFGI